MLYFIHCIRVSFGLAGSVFKDNIKQHIRKQMVHFLCWMIDVIDQKLGYILCLEIVKVLTFLGEGPQGSKGKHSRVARGWDEDPL